MITITWSWRLSVGRNVSFGWLRQSEELWKNHEWSCGTAIVQECLWLWHVQRSGHRITIRFGNARRIEHDDDEMTAAIHILLTSKTYDVIHARSTKSNFVWAVVRMSLAIWMEDIFGISQNWWPDFSWIYRKAHYTSDGERKMEQMFHNHCTNRCSGSVGDLALTLKQIGEHVLSVSEIVIIVSMLFGIW